MTIVFPDPEILTRQYLEQVLAPRWPGLIVTGGEPPRGIDWQRDKVYAIVINASGNGNRTGVVYEMVLLGFDVYGPTQSEASLLAAELRAFLGEWSSISGDVAGHSDNARPVRNTSATAYPQYWYSANIMFKARELEEHS